MHELLLNALNTLACRIAAKICPGALAARRLKRMPSIVGKLRRFPKMQASRMQDIGGWRLDATPLSGPLAPMLYDAAEQQWKDDPCVSVLLLSVAKLQELREAYPNYYLDASLFLQHMKRICSKFRRA